MWIATLRPCREQHNGAIPLAMAGSINVCARAPAATPRAHWSVPAGRPMIHPAPSRSVRVGLITRPLPRAACTA
jgi:hypothetical protein